MTTISIKAPSKYYRCAHPDCDCVTCIVHTYSHFETDHPTYCMHAGCKVEFKECDENGKLIE